VCVFVCVCVQMYIKCMFTVESSYYNEKVAIWEPFIEPVEDKEIGRHRPWQLVIEVRAVLCV